MAISLDDKLSTMQRGNTFAVAGCKGDEVERLIDVTRPSRCGRSLIIVSTIKAAVSAANDSSSQATRLPLQMIRSIQ